MNLTVAYQGVPGAFAEEACRLFLPGCEAVAKPSFAAVVRAVVQGETELGMLPRENSTAGLVPGIDELIGGSGLVVHGCHPLPVRLHLMARPGVAFKEIETVTSHPMALAQCTNFLQRNGLASDQAENTAAAAQALRESGDRTRAVVASETAAATYGLTILRRDVHDRPDNVTTFCVVARKHEEEP